MDSEIKLVSGAMVALGLATAALVVMPYIQARDIKPPPELHAYTDQQLRGRAVYVANGCVYCHSQQPRDRKFGPDAARGWGRASVPGDYVYDRPHLLGSMRTGPDLFNIGARQPSADWHLGHLYQPRAYTPGSIMPAYPYLFRTKAAADDGEQVLALPAGVSPVGTVVVATPDAQDLVKYLQGMNHTYAVLPPIPVVVPVVVPAKLPAAVSPAVAPPAAPLGVPAASQP
jgi:cytochrome c oxidase cbb3-type subunit II